MLLERFYDTLPEDLKLWLIDKAPETLVVAARLADTYAVNHEIYSKSVTNKTAYPIEVKCLRRTTILIKRNLINT